LNAPCIMTVSELLKIVQVNKKRHEDMREEALAGYLEDAAAQCKQVLEDLRGTCRKLTHVHINMSPPADHAADYARAIRMLEHTTAETVALDERDFSNLVDDNWDWTDSWVKTNSYFSKPIAEYGMSKGL